VKRLLSDNEEAVREDVGPLIKTVVATNKFEREMAAMFGGGAVQDDDDDLQVGCRVFELQRVGVAAGCTGLLLEHAE
jgi:hypothetical protein